MKDLKCEVAFMYGENDWVERDSADRMITKGEIQGKIFIASKSGHHLYAENAFECSAHLITFVFGDEARKEFVQNEGN